MALSVTLFLGFYVCQHATDEFALMKLVFLGQGLNLGEKRLEPIFDHVFGAVWKEFFAHFGPSTTVVEHKLQN